MTTPLLLLSLLVVLALLGGVTGAGAVLLSRPVSQLLLGLVGGGVLLYLVWMCSLWAAVTALEELGIHLQGRSIYLAVPVAPGVAVVFGPLAVLAHLGRTAQPRGFFLVLGAVLALAVGGAATLALSGVQL